MTSKIKDGFLFCVLYFVGLILGLVFQIFRFLGFIEIQNWERFPHKTGNLILVSNHPSLYEPILLPLLFFKEYALRPVRFAPYSTPDESNYYKRWYWSWIRPRAIPIDRGNQRKEIRALLQMKELLNKGKVIVLFPEAGRTFKGEEFFYSKKGKRIRILKEGVGLLIQKTNPTILPVWVEGTNKVIPNSKKRLYCFPRFWRSSVIKIGHPIKINGETPRERIAQKLATILLELADEEE